MRAANDLLKILKKQTIGEMDMAATKKQLKTLGNFIVWQENLSSFYYDARANELSKEKIKELVTTQGKNGNTMLHLAAAFNDKTLIEKLLEAGANVDVKNNAGKTPLFYAVKYADKNQYDDACQVLLKHHADVHMQDSLGGSILELTNKPWLLKLLFAHVDWSKLNKEEIDQRFMTPLIKEKEEKEIKGVLDIVAESTNYGLNTAKFKNLTNFIENTQFVTARSKDDKTALHYAVEFGDRFASLVQVLLEVGADVHAKDKHGRTPLHYAMGRANFLDIAVKLIEQGAKLNTMDKDGNTPLAYLDRKNLFADCPSNTEEIANNILQLIKLGTNPFAVIQKSKDDGLHNLWTKILAAKNEQVKVSGPSGVLHIERVFNALVIDMVKEIANAMPFEKLIDSFINSEESKLLLKDKFVFGALVKTLENYVEIEKVSEKFLSQGLKKLELEKYQSDRKFLGDCFSNSSLLSAAASAGMKSIGQFYLGEKTLKRLIRKQNNLEFEKTKRRALRIIDENKDAINWFTDSLIEKLVKSSTDLNLSILQKAVEKGLAFDWNQPIFNEYPFEWVVDEKAKNSVKMLEWLVAQGLDIHNKDVLNDVLSTIFLNPNPQQIAVLKWLVEKGVDLNVKYGGGKSPILKMIRLMSFRDNKNKAIASEMINLLVKAGIDINSTEDDGSTLIDYLLSDDEWTHDVLLPLLPKFGDVNVLQVDEKGLLAFWALDNEDYKLLDALFDAGLDVNIRDKKQNTLLHQAIKKGKLIEVKIVMARQPNLELVDNQGKKAKEYIDDTKIRSQYISWERKNQDSKKQDQILEHLKSDKQRSDLPLHSFERSKQSIQSDILFDKGHRLKRLRNSV